MRMLGMLFGKVLLVVFDFNIQPLVRNQAAFEKRILVRMPQGDKFIVALEIGEFQCGDQFDRLDRSVPRPFQLFRNRLELATLSGTL